MPDDGGIDVSTFTPEQQAALQAQIEPQGVDPVDTMDANQLAELSVQTKGQFDPLAWADENQQRAFEPATLKKLSDARDIITSRGLGGFVVGDIPAVQSIKEGKPVEAAVKIVKPVAETVGNIAKWFGNTIIANPANVVMGKANELFGGNPDLTNELYKQAAKGSGETVAGVESAMFGLANTGKKAAGLFSDTSTDEGKQQKFLSDLGLFQQQKTVGAGQGEFAEAVGTDAAALARVGVVLDPAIIAERASGDPFAFYAFGKGFQALTPAGKVLATVPGVAGLQAASRALVSKGLRWTAKEGVDLTGKTISGAGAVTKFAGKAAPVTGAVVGAVKGGPLGSIAGATTGKLAARSIGAVGDAVKSTGDTLSAFSKSLAVEAGPTGSYTQLARDIIAAAPTSISNVAKGAGVDFGFAAATSETPQDTEGMATFGTTFGALHGVTRTARRVIQGQTLGSRPWGTTEKTKPYGRFANLDAAHAAAEQTRTPAEIQRADAIRAFAATLPGGAEAYLMPDTVAFENFLVDDYARKNGAAPTGQALTDIKSKALSRGMFSEEMLDDAGNQRRVIILNEVDAAPHEAAHAIQDVIGEKANEVVDALVKKEYEGQWEAIGENYARRLGGTAGTPWRDTILKRTGHTDADVYLARELAAENFDIGFKNKGGDFGRGNTLPERLARIAVKTAVFFGGDPYVGAQTQGLRIQPKAGVIEAVAGQVELAKGTPPVIPAAPVAPLVAPRTPAPAKPVVAAPTPATSAVTGVSADAKAAQAWAAGKNDPRLVNIVNSIVANQVKSAPGEAAPVRLKYLSVVGEEGSTRTPRRSEQEAAYLAEALGAMPAETRQLVEKTHAHVRFESVKKGNEYQSIGYSLEKLVENAQRTAKWMSENPEAAKLSPYAVEGTSFSSEGWKQLVSDIETYTGNQQAGGTGAGKALVQPANAAKLGISVPPVQAAKFSPLEQSRADFINTLMGFKLPETTRVSRSGGTPGNIVGQDISLANDQPFIQQRVSEPANQRAGGKEFPGFPGRTIQEVNPLRKQLEAAGFPVNELTEVVERVNLKSLESVTAAPESSFRPGVTDTIRAGFLPAEEKPKWVVKGQKGGLKTSGTFEGTDMGEARRKAEAQGYRVSSVERTNPIELRTQFLPAEEEAKLVDSLDSADFTKWSKEQPGGLTGTAHRVGREATSQEFVNSLNTTAEKYRVEAKKALESKDFDVVMPIVMKGQFFREAWEAATGSGGSGDMLKKQDAGYKAPFPKAQFSPADDIREIAKGYAKSAGIDYAPGKPATVLNEDLGKRLADFYDEAKTNPSDPEVQKSYQALADETLAQYQAMAEAGYSVEPYEGNGEPYKNSAEMVADVRDNKHLYFLRTEGNFSGGDNALLADSGVSINGKPLLVNDVFRAVHDFFGHAKEGLQFGPKGEFNAWRVHSEMYSPEAQGALAAETLAQNSFVNFGKHLRDAEGNVPKKGEPGYVPLPERPFGEQKNVVVPSDLIAEAKAQFSPKDPYEKYNREFNAAVAKRKAGTKSGLTGWILPDNKFVPLSQSYHEQYLAENSADLNKQFKTKFSKKENVEERGHALNNGFVRVREQPTGTLHIEARQNKWSKAVRDTVFEVVAENLDSIDQIQISLLDQSDIVKRQGYARLLDFDSDAEKLNHIPLISDSK